MSGCSLDFVLDVRLIGLHFQPLRKEGLSFDAGGDRNLRFAIVPRDPEAQHFIELDGKVRATYEVDPEVFAFAEAFNRNRLLASAPEKPALPYVVLERVLIDEHGHFAEGWHPSRDLCPEPVRTLLDRVEAELLEDVTRFLHLLRWRQDIDAPGEVVENAALYWRVGDGDYPHVPSVRQEGSVPMMVGIRWGEEPENELRLLWNNPELKEPLGHELLREADSLAETSQRSAILIAATSIETAVKAHVSARAPDTVWLLEELPSPPIYKILKDYLPALHPEQAHELWRHLKPYFVRVQQMFEIRNKVAHTGKVPEAAEKVRDYLDLTRDVLYVLDVLAGHDWAKQRVSPNLRGALGWPAPPETRGFVTFSTPY